MPDNIECIVLAAFFFPAAAAVLVFFMNIQTRLVVVEKMLKDVE
jgi:hypothetical protein